MVLESDPYIWGTGRRKTSVARVRIKAGTGNVTVNKKPLKDYFNTDAERSAAVDPLAVTEPQERYDIWVNVSGCGMTGQADASKMCLGRHLAQALLSLHVRLPLAHGRQGARHEAGAGVEQVLDAGVGHHGA